MPKEAGVGGVYASVALNMRTRVQAIVVRGDRVLMVKHRVDGERWWCLPGGALEPGESLQEGVLRELREECNLAGEVVRQTSHFCFGPEDEAYTFLVEIGDQEPRLGHDPEVQGDEAILVDVRWLSLREIAERDRAFLWASGLLAVGEFLSEVASWGDDISYPGGE